MNNIHLSKSSYCDCVQCEKIIWLKMYNPNCSVENNNDAILKTGNEVGNLAKGFFGDYCDVPFDEDLSVRIEMTEKLLLDRPNVITEASFSFNNNFCSVDILKNDNDGVEIYEVKSSTKVKDIYIDDASYQCYVLSGLGFNVKKVCIVYINNEYIKNGELDIGELFNIEDITDIAFQKLDEIDDMIEHINGFMKTHDASLEPSKEIGMQCFDPYDCGFWNHCTEKLPSPNVFDIAGMNKSKKFEKYYEGKISFEDLKNDDLNPKYLEQIDFELNDRDDKIIESAVREILDSLKYPLYFIDYESCQHAVPELDGTKPYQQIPFQYSLHIIHERGGELEHREFLAESDDKNMIRSFAESMIEDMPEDGSVIVYNKAFEATRNREIARMYPDLAQDMGRFNANMVDLMIPFRKRQYYTKDMKGSFSIKYVLPALYPDDPELDYSQLYLIHKGDEASNAFLSLNEKSSQEREKIRKALLEYCRLDTYAMVKIWDRFREIADEK